MIITAIKIICIILAIVLIVLVILQQGKGSDLGSAFGGGSSNSMFGAVGPSNFLGKLTAFIATLFLILNLAQAVLLKNANTEVLFTDEEIQEATKRTEQGTGSSWQFRELWRIRFKGSRPRTAHSAPN